MGMTILSVMIRIIIMSALLLLYMARCQAQQRIPLYADSIPGAIAGPDQEASRMDAASGLILSLVSRPTLSVFLPPAGKANGTAVIICPGGGYGVLCIQREGDEVARAFNKLGITAFVLKYRLPDDRIMKDKSTGPLQDAQQAIRLVRQQAARWHIDPKKIGIMGFSAGGHLASTAGTHFGQAVDLRPDFMVLVYPVISFKDSIGHKGSRDNLLGKAPSAAQVRLYSNEYQVTASTPPAYIVHAGDDRVVPVANSLRFYEALQQQGVRAALHIYEKGDHGFLSQPPFEEWFGRCIFWMKQEGWLR